MINFNKRVVGTPNLAAFVVVAMAALAAGPTLAASALADAPLFTSSATPVKPNIMFILDDSGSMANNYLPDAAGTFASGTYGPSSSQCNGVAYNYNVVYPLPVKYDGTPVGAAPDIYKEDATKTTSQNPTSSNPVPVVSSGSVSVTVTGKKGSSWYSAGDTVTIFSSATTYMTGTVTSWTWTGGNSNGSGTLTIDVQFSAGSGNMNKPKVGNGLPSSSSYTYSKYKGARKVALDFSYDSSGKAINDAFFKECNNTIGSTAGKALFDTVTVNQFSDEAQNYANWYTYYRTRMQMMKAGISLAFKDLDQKYRIGFTTISETSLDEAGDFLNIRDFDPRKDASNKPGQKENFYAAVNAANPSGYTPLRAALSKVGRYYAKQISGQTYDPIQYSCQRNFTILSTDGFWNAQDETGSYKPYKLNGSTLIGDEDKSLVRPMLDTKGASSSLADVAAYYYQNDLRDSSLGNCTGSLGAGVDVCKNNVTGKTQDAYHSYGDAAAWQHMTTFTLGLGVSGTLTYDKNYLSVHAGDFQQIVTNQLDWPAPTADKPTAVDDLWHAAVNGRGQYFSAGDPASLSAGLNSALATIQAVVGSASAASTSSLQPVAGDNDIFVAQFTTQEWTGDVLAYKIDPTTGDIPTTKTWSAKDQLEAMDYTKRKIYYSKPGAATPTLSLFTYTNLKNDSLNSNFDSFCTMTGAGGAGIPSQCATLGVADLPLANSGANLVDYLVGNQALTYYRTRTARLGDIINASPLFIGKPQFKYQDTGYSSYVTTNSTRTAVVLAAANDGMLHAFDRKTGNELWAFVPSDVIPNMYKLADANFQNYHSYYVDGSPQVGDVLVGSTWKTIVIGGMNKGGRSYYALDVTDPGNPKMLWEFKNKNLGLSYGNPIITKRKDGTWVVVFSSGYENGTDVSIGTTGDGNGHLFVLNAYTGAPLEDIKTYTDSAKTIAAGSAAAPNGMAKINNWVVDDTDNTSLRFYAGDLLGNVWRFDIDNQVAPNKSALLLATLKDASSNAQPVTVKPALAEVTYNGAKIPVVYVPTGAYIRTSDATDVKVQSVYAIKDPLTNSPYGNPRGNAAFVVQTINKGTDANGKPTRTSVFSAVNWTTAAGWYQDFPVGGERVSVNPQLALDTLFVGSNVPSTDACTIGGDSFLYEFDINSGNFVGSYVGGVLVQGLTVVQLTTGPSAGSIVTIITRSDGTLQTDVNAPVNPTAALKRSSWRELVN